MRFVLAIVGTGVPTWTCGVVPGGSWSCSSDRRQKENLEPLDGIAVLDKVATLPVYQRNPKGVNAHHRHYGPTGRSVAGGTR